MQRLPPLNSLHVFEAAARLSSFSKAAAELNVTAAAVAHHVKKLETELAIELFERFPRGVRLSDAGAQYLEISQSILEQLMDKTRRFKSQHHNVPIRIGGYHIVADRLIRPLLRDFVASYSDVRAELIADLPEPDFHARQLDVLFWHGVEPPAGYFSRKITSETLTPVCAPQLLESFGGKLSIENLTEIPSLYDINWEHDWPDWLNYVGGPRVSNSVGFSLYAAMIQTVCEGGGIAIGRTGLLKKELDDGLLVKPFPQEIIASKGYFALTTEAALEKPNVLVFWKWIEEKFEV